ncbi:VgrG-related protein [Streptomyces sp. MS2.AVA.5]|uniref:VgrG-related protein n=1 Tax=Streptomyces achmelvichensis TaxID=3134111 RepID=A0ACC6PLA3_9ACTN
MTGRHTAGLAIEVNGRRLLGACETSMAWATVEESVRISATAEIGFRDPYQASILSEAGLALGSRIQLTVLTPDGTHALFDGEVTGCEARAAADSGVFTVIRAEDHAHRLRRGTRTRAYHQMSAGQIVQKVADLAGLRTGTIDTTGLMYEFVTQPAMSDWDFLSHLARENGREILLRDGALHFRAPARASEAPAVGASPQQSPFVLEFGHNLINVSAVATLEEQVSAVTVRGWDSERKTPLVARQIPHQTPARDVEWRPDHQAVHAEPLVLATLPRSTQNEVEQVADAMACEVAAGLTRLRALVRGEPRIRLRSAVTVTGVGSQYEGRYTVTSARHEYHPDSGFLSELTVNEGADRVAPGRSGDSETGLRRFYGLVPGTVTNIKDPKEQGRVKVQLPWLSDDYESNWARTVQFGGSRGHGVVVPEVGDEVLVGFEHGSLDRPYVLGSLYNGVDKLAPNSLDLIDGTKGITQRRSFASKEGHRLELSDAGSRGMGATLVTGDGKLSITLDQHRTLVSVHSDGKVEITSANGVTVDAGDAPLELSGSRVTVKAKHDISLSGTDIKLKATSGLDATGAKIKIAGGALAEISASLVKIN